MGRGVSPGSYSFLTSACTSLLLLDKPISFSHTGVAVHCAFHLIVFLSEQIGFSIPPGFYGIFYPNAVTANKQ